MKFSTIFQTISLVATTGFVSAATGAGNSGRGITGAEDCKFGKAYKPDLSKLPEGVDPDNIRQCQEHPLGSPTAHISKRDCYYDAPFGCSDGYCWKQCGVEGSGQWCWTASNGGFGPWIGCSTNAQCNEAQACGVGDEDCGSCGCSC